MKLQGYRFLSFILLIVLLGFWEIGTKDSYQQGGFIPPLSVVIETFFELAREGVLLQAILDSLTRFFIGISIGSLGAIGFGFILGRFVHFEIILEPFIQLFRPISPLAWLPIIVLWMGIGEVGAIFVIVYAVFFPVLILTITGVRQVNKDLLKMATNFQANELLIFKSIILPGTFLYISSGLKLAASIAWIHLVAGEMLGIQSGLGYLIIDGRNLLRMDMVIVGVFLIGILGYLLHLLFVAFEKMIKRQLGDFA